MCVCMYEIPSSQIRTISVNYCYASFHLTRVFSTLFTEDNYDFFFIFFFLFTLSRGGKYNNRRDREKKANDVAVCPIYKNFIPLFIYFFFIYAEYTHLKREENSYHIAIGINELIS